MDVIMSHGYTPAGNASGGQWQSGYPQQGPAGQPAQPQGGQQFAQPQGGQQFAQPQSYAGQPQQQGQHVQGGAPQYAPQQSAPYSGYQGVGGQMQGGPQQFAQQQSYVGQPQGGQQLASPQQHAQARSHGAQPQSYAGQPQQQGQHVQGGAPQYAPQQSAPYSGYQGVGGQVQGNQTQQFAQPQSYGGQPQVTPQQYGGAQYAQPQSYAGQPQQHAGRVQGGAPQYAGAQLAPSQQAQASTQLTKDPRADDWVRLKGSANVAIVNSVLRFFGIPFLSLLIAFARGHDLYDTAKKLNAPSDVLLRARIAMGTATFLFFAQVAILLVIVISPHK